jgi:hypothetical protein
MRGIVNGRLRKIRGGRLVAARPWGGPARLLPAAQRRRDMESAQQDAKRKFPNLDAKLEGIAKSIREARISGRRFAYKEPLQELYEMAHRWNEADELKKRVGYVAALRAIPVRANANLFSVLVRAVLDADADRKTVSRWSISLKKALEDDVAPSDLEI